MAWEISRTHRRAWREVFSDPQVDALPTRVMVNAGGQEQGRKIGYIDKSVLRRWLEEYGPVSQVEAPSAQVMPSEAGLIAD